MIFPQSSSWPMLFQHEAMQLVLIGQKESGCCPAVFETKLWIPWHVQWNNVCLTVHKCLNDRLAPGSLVFKLCSQGVAGLFLHIRFHVPRNHSTQFKMFASATYYSYLWEFHAPEINLVQVCSTSTALIQDEKDEQYISSQLKFLFLPLIVDSMMSIDTFMATLKNKEKKKSFRLPKTRRHCRSY